MKSLIAILIVITLNLSAMYDACDLYNPTQTKEYMCFKNQLTTLTQLITEKLTVGLLDNKKLPQITQSIAYAIIERPMRLRVITMINQHMCTYDGMCACANLKGADFYKNWNKVYFLLYNMKKYNSNVCGTLYKHLYAARNNYWENGALTAAEKATERFKRHLCTFYYKYLPNAYADTFEEIGNMLICYCWEVHNALTLQKLLSIMGRSLSATDKNQAILSFFENEMSNTYTASKLQKYKLAFNAAIPIIVNDSELCKQFVRICESAVILETLTKNSNVQKLAILEAQQLAQQRCAKLKKAVYIHKVRIISPSFLRSTTTECVCTRRFKFANQQSELQDDAVFEVDENLLLPLSGMMLTNQQVLQVCNQKQIHKDGFPYDFAD